MASSRTSSTKSARPVRSRAASLRRTDSPIRRVTGEPHGRDDVLVAGAAAQVSRKGFADFTLVRRGAIAMVAQKRDQRHEHSGRTESALQPVGLAKRGLKRVERV